MQCLIHNVPHNYETHAAHPALGTHSDKEAGSTQGQQHVTGKKRVDAARASLREAHAKARKSEQTRTDARRNTWASRIEEGTKGEGPHVRHTTRDGEEKHQP